MRRFSPVFALGILVLLGLSFALAGCGDDEPAPRVATSIQVSLTSASLNLGETVQLAAAAVDENGSAVLTDPITFSSSNTAVATVASNGLICAGTWDSLSNPVVCTPGQAGPATVTASVGSLTSPVVNVFVHPRIARVTVDPPPACVAVGGTLQLTAHAFTGADATPATEIPADQLGPFTWTSTDTNIATVDSAGVVTMRAAGSAMIVASVSGTSSLGTLVQSCP